MFQREDGSYCLPYFNCMAVKLFSLQSENVSILHQTTWKESAQPCPAPFQDRTHDLFSSDREKVGGRLGIFLSCFPSRDRVTVGVPSAWTWGLWPFPDLLIVLLYSPDLGA